MSARRSKKILALSFYQPVGHNANTAKIIPIFSLANIMVLLNLKMLSMVVLLACSTWLDVEDS